MALKSLIYMTTLIRYNAFETNSSSSHTITLGWEINGLVETNRMDTSLIPDKNGVIELNPVEDIGSSAEIRSAEEKCIYYFLSVIKHLVEKSSAYSPSPSLEEYARLFFNDNMVKNPSWNTFCEVIKYQTGAKEVRVFSEESEKRLLKDIKNNKFTYFWEIIGGVSTPDDAESFQLIQANPIYLRNFIFDTKTGVYITYDG